MLSLSQLLQLRLKLVSSEMPLGGVMEQSPPLWGIAVGVIAVGVFAVGVIAVGVIAVGVIAVGVIAVGVIAVGVIAVEKS